MSHVDTSPLSMYNSLSDPHLAGYFANTKMRNHLRRSGLITRRGEIVPENSYRMNMARKEHKKHVKDLLAHAIVQKTLDLERHRQVAIRQKLEEIAKIELVQRVKDDRKINHYSESLLPLLTPRKGKGQAKGQGNTQETGSPGRHQTPSPHPEDNVVIEERTQKQRRNDEDLLPYISPRSSRPHSGPSPRSHRSNRSSKYRPISAPSNMPDTNSSMYESNDEDADVTYVDDHGNPVEWSELDTSRGRSRTPRSWEEIDARHLYSLNPAALRRYATTLARMEQTSSLVSPYLMPQVPIPPSSPRSAPHRHRGYRTRSASSDKSPKRSPGHDLHRQEPPMSHQGDIHSMCEVTMKYHGWALNLAREKIDPRQEIQIEQQHCGGNTLTVFRDKLVPGSTFTFTSKRHRGYPFSLTLYVDGRQDARVSTCCELGHSRKVRLGGKQGHFSIVKIAGMSPCYKCQVQKGLRGTKAPPKKLKHPAKGETGEEVIVVDTVAKEQTPQRQDDTHPAEPEDESAIEQILVPVEPEGQEPGGADTADEYEDDFDEEDEKEEPDEDDSAEETGVTDDAPISPSKCLMGAGAATARTDIEVEGQEAEESEHTDKTFSKDNPPRDASYKFYTKNKREVTEVEEDVQDESSKSHSASSNSDSFHKLKEKYGVQNSDEGSKSSSSSISSHESKKKNKTKTVSYSTDTFQAASEVDPSDQQEVDAAAADTADDVSDIETDVEWPRKPEEDVEAKRLVVDGLPPKPQKPQVLQGILSPKREKRLDYKKKTTFQLDETVDNVEKPITDTAVQESSDVPSSDDGLHRAAQSPGKKKYKKNRHGNKQEKHKNYDVGIVACNPEQEESEGLEHLAATDVSDRTREDLSSDIPEVSVKRSGVTLFSERVETEPCREHVTVGKTADDDEENDERGTESDENHDVEKKDVVSESEMEGSVDVVAQYAAHLSELEDRTTTESGLEKGNKVIVVPDTSSGPDTQNVSRESGPTDTEGQTRGKTDDSDVHTTEDAKDDKEVVALPTIIVNSTDSRTAETGINSQNRQSSTADIKSKQFGGVPRRVSAGGESLLSVPCSDVDENAHALWSGGPSVHDDVEADSPRKSSLPVSPDLKQPIPVILVNEGAQEPQQDLNPPGVRSEGTSQSATSTTHNPEYTSDSDSDSSSSSSSSSCSSSKNVSAKPADVLPKSGAPLTREDSTTVPTIITEHVD